jgi:hypothetical protein
MEEMDINPYKAPEAPEVSATAPSTVPVAGPGSWQLRSVLVFAACAAAFHMPLVSISIIVHYVEALNCFEDGIVIGYCRLLLFQWDVFALFVVVASLSGWSNARGQSCAVVLAIEILVYLVVGCTFCVVRGLGGL